MNKFLGRSRTIQEGRSSTSNITDIISNPFLNRITTRGSGSNSSQNVVQIEDEINIDRNLELYNTHQLDILNPRILYQAGIMNINTVLIRSSREESLRVVERSNTIDLISPETIQKIKESNKRFIHIGLVVIGIKGLGRKELGTKVLTLLMDKSWTTNMKKALISGTEVDLSQNSAIFYCLPSILKDINDLNNLKIGIKTKGYEEGYKGNNLIVSIGVLGKASNRSGMNFKVNINGIVKNISSKGIIMIDPVKINPEDLAGLDWSLKDFKICL